MFYLTFYQHQLQPADFAIAAAFGMKSVALYRLLVKVRSCGPDTLQAVNRQIGLEQQLHTLKENEQALQTLQESLSQLDHTLTSYLTDRIDAFQLPQEAQVRSGSATPEGSTSAKGSLTFPRYCQRCFRRNVEKMKVCAGNSFA